MEIVRKDTKPAPITLDMVPAGTAFEFAEPCSPDDEGRVYMNAEWDSCKQAQFIDLKTGVIYLNGRPSEKPVKILNATVVIKDKDGAMQ